MEEGSYKFCLVWRCLSCYCMRVGKGVLCEYVGCWVYFVCKWSLLMGGMQVVVKV